jgi:hypothetical protein
MRKLTLLIAAVVVGTCMLAQDAAIQKSVAAKGIKLVDIGGVSSKPPAKNW